jgi:hypothetical protein
VVQYITKLDRHVCAQGINSFVGKTGKKEMDGYSTLCVINYSAQHIGSDGQWTIFSGVPSLEASASQQ